MSDFDIETAVVDVVPAESTGRVEMAASGRNPVDIARKVAEHLAERNNPPSLFRMGEQGDIARVEADGSLFPYDADEWLYHVASEVDFFTSSKEGTKKMVGPPQQSMRMIPAALRSKLPALDGVVTTPYLDAGGLVISEDGYHRTSRLFLRSGGLTLPPVPDNPSHAEVHAAGRLLTDEWLGDFPFETTADLAAAVALMLTLTGRAFTGLAPMFVIDASTPGSGKGLLVLTTNIIASGQAPNLLELPYEGEEQRKKITSALLAGADFIVWDETHTIAGRTLAMILTAEVYSDRILGGSKMMAIHNRFTQVALGNNVQVFGDMKRRVVPVRLVPAMEHPETRQDFRHANLGQWVRDHRGELLAAALTLWRAWIVAGKPRADVTMGSFEKWASVIGGVLEVAEIGGFMTGTSSWLEDSDPDTDGWATHLAALYALSGGNEFTIAQVAQWTTTINQRGDRLLELPVPRRKDSDPEPKREIGNLYLRQRDRWHGGYSLRCSKERKSPTGGKMWLVAKSSSPGIETRVPDSVDSVDSVNRGNPDRITESLSHTESPNRGSIPDRRREPRPPERPPARQAVTPSDVFGNRRPGRECPTLGCKRLATTLVGNDWLCSDHAGDHVPGGAR